MSEGDRACPRCGQAIPEGQSDCPYCARPHSWWTVQRETLLVASIVGLVILFAITGVAANFYHAKQKALAQEWFVRGEQALKAGNASKALEDFHTTLAYAPDSYVYRLRLAQALMAAHRTDEARSHLLTLWRDEPGNATVNLELARLAVDENDTSDALRYFHNAIYGVWSHNPEEQRRQVRLELCQYLIRQGARYQAQSELIALAGELPSNAALHVQVAGLFLKAGDPARSLDEYREALVIDRHSEDALVGAGEVAFQMGNYSLAASYLDRAARSESAPPQAEEMLKTARLVLELDPYSRRLPRAEADRRVLHAYQIASARLSACLKSRGLSPQPAPNQQPNALQTLEQNAQKLGKKAHPYVLSRNPDLRLNFMDLVSGIEETTEKQCGAPSGEDRALLLIARMQGGSGQ
jgi:tetratricopeptide (TPR) repeat protein